MIKVQSKSALKEINLDQTLCQLNHEKLLVSQTYTISLHWFIQSSVQIKSNMKWIIKKAENIFNFKSFWYSSVDTAIWQLDCRSFGTIHLSAIVCTFSKVLKIYPRYRDGNYKIEEKR